MVFVKRETNEDETFNVGVTMGHHRAVVTGKVGIEVEVEGKKLPKEPLAPWVYHVDHSLRGAENAEYVLSSPVEFDDVSKHIDNLWKLFKDKGSTLDDSNRTSVHVHLNCQPFFLNRLAALMGLYFIFEEVLTEWCGEHRVGNLFCLRAKDAPAIVSQIRRFIRTGMQAPIRDHHHYAGMNANALQKFGSLEFRALRGVSDPEVIKTWVSVLRRLYDLSETFANDPATICHEYSYGGPLAFFETLLGDKADLIRSGIEFNQERIETSMQEGVRLAQDICFARDWSRYTPVEYKEDPFQRQKRRRVGSAAGGFDINQVMAEVDADMQEQEAEFINQPIPPLQATPAGFATINSFTTPTTVWINQFTTQTEN